MSCEAFREYLLGNFGIPVTPGTAFQSDRHVRLPFGADDEVLKELLNRMGRALLPLRRAPATSENLSKSM